jgi:hypothetical protein
MPEATPRNFFFAVWRHWQALLSGGVVAVAGIFWAQFGSPGGVPSWAFWLVAVACLFIACWMAWHDIYVKLESERRKHEPNLTAEILDFVLGENADGSQVSVYVILAIKNTGEMPSIADHWRIVVSPPNGIDLIARLVWIDKPVVLGMRSGTEKTLSPIDAIYKKTEHAPIQFGAKATGFIGGSITAPLSNIATFGTKVTVEFRDVLGRTITAEQVIRGPGGDLNHHPGITMTRTK